MLLGVPTLNPLKQISYTPSDTVRKTKSAQQMQGVKGNKDENAEEDTGSQGF
jgi:hypothetical protein